MTDTASPTANPVMSTNDLRAELVAIDEQIEAIRRDLLANAGEYWNGDLNAVVKHNRLNAETATLEGRKTLVHLSMDAAKKREAEQRATLADEARRVRLERFRAARDRVVSDLAPAIDAAARALAGLVDERLKVLQEMASLDVKDPNGRAMHGPSQEVGHIAADTGILAQLLDAAGLRIPGLGSWGQPKTCAEHDAERLRFRVD